MLRVVLINPQIPPNTGNIARTCAATRTELHLVGPLGFEISDRYLKRAGLDYWPYVKSGGRAIGFTVRGSSSYVEYSYQSGDWLIFGSETDGIPADLLNQCDHTVYIPMAEPGVRSLNLSVSVAIGLFEARRQLGFIR
ncbi:MAG: tRNA (cytidine(34)-2'-O)-methyltransferase [Microcystis aeruginosa Ma_AC_P_19900807_S299]|nr:MAG: tRNA (cytidine(34)-2'-O)-methyltransferase [Microcystis aeruginosa Ma_AC_P_19900807_S299]